MNIQQIEKLLPVIKEQACLFLLEAGEFYPFGTCIDQNDKFKPVSLYIEHVFPSSSEIISS